MRCRSTSRRGGNNSPARSRPLRRRRDASSGRRIGSGGLRGRRSEDPVRRRRGAGQGARLCQPEREGHVPTSVQLSV